MIQIRKDKPHPLLQDAVACHQAGRIGTAKTLYGRVLVDDPKNPDALHLLGVIAYQEGRHDQSADLISRAIQEDSHQAPFYSNLGNTFKAMGKWQRALVCFKKALDLDPHMADALFNLAYTYQKQGDYDHAVDYYQRAAKFNPGYVQIYNNMGIAFDNMGMIEAAVSAYRTAIQINPKYIDAYNNLSQLFEGINQLEAALQTAQDALRLDPSSIFALLNLSQIYYRLHRFQDALTILKSLVERELPRKLHSRACYLLGKIYNRLDRYDAAFESFAKANRLIRESHTMAAYRKGNVDTLRQIVETGRFFTPERVRRWRSLRSACESIGQAFLVGFPRSGTTLLEQILNAHSQVATLDEQPIFEEIFRPFRHPGDGLEQLDCLSENELAHYRHSYLQSATHRIGNSAAIRLIVDKLPLNILYLGVIYRFFPNAKVIVALRHPLGCMLSNFMQQFKMNKMMFNFLSLEGAAEFYARVMQLYLQYRQVLPLQLHQVRYEDLVQNFESEVRRLFSFLELEWQQGVLKYHELAQNRKISTPSYSQVVKPIYDDAVHRWKRYRSHLSPAFHRLAPFMESFGYQ